MPDSTEPSIDPGATQPMARPPGSIVGGGELDLPLPEELSLLLPRRTYQVANFIGQGGMGAVYKGTQVRLQRTVAIKIMRRDQGKDLGFEERFRREALAMAQLNHPNIVNVIDYGEAGPEYLYIVMEFIDGADLLDVIRTGRMTQDMALTLLPQICDALQFAHEHGIVHRDIKPSNIMLTRDGRVKIADFGLAKRYDVESDYRTQTGAGMGTPDYAAPEQLDDVAHVDHRADIYALGVMIYQMITGHLPRGTWKPPSQRAEVDPHWDDIVKRALQADPKKRYDSAAELKTEVSRITPRPAVKQPPAGPAPDKTGSGTNEPVRRNVRRLRIFGAAILIPSLVCVAIAYHLLNDTANRRPRETSTPPPVPAATKDKPFVNSLGMKFVPLPGTSILMCMHETRKKDYAAFAKETPGISKDWRYDARSEVPIANGDDHPAITMNWWDAKRFCDWLSAVEGRTYRLPTDREWSMAVGLGAQEKEGETPQALDKNITGVFPWGEQWPPPARAGNYSDTSASERMPKMAILQGYSDGFPTTAPVMSFSANKLGLHDLGGNVWEWCEDPPKPGSLDRVLRGGSWLTNQKTDQLSSCRLIRAADLPAKDIGFRVALDTAAPARPAAPVADDRKAADWVLRMGGRVTVFDGDKRIVTRDVKALPAGKLALAAVEMIFDSRRPAEPIYDLAPLAGLRNLDTIVVNDLRTISDEDMKVLATMPALQSVSIHRCDLTDAAFTAFADVKELMFLSVFGNTPITGSGLPALTKLERLTRLNIASCGLTDEGIAQLKGLPRLSFLSVGGTRFGDSHLSVLDGMSKLTSLAALNSHITPGGLAAHPSLSKLIKFSMTIEPGNADDAWALLARTCPNLEQLDVAGTGGEELNERDLAGLSTFPKLRYLWLQGAAITDATLGAVPELKCLRDLVLNQPASVTDSSISALLSHNALASIAFNKVQVTDGGLLRLSALKSLKRVDINNCPDVTDAGVAALKKARPDMEVLR